MSMPTLTLARSVPDAVRRAPLLPGHKSCWTLKAEFPAPHGAVFLRYSRPERGDDCLDVLTAAGKLLHRLEDAELDASAPDGLRAEWLDPRTRKGPLTSFTHLYRFWLAFPDGFAGLCTLSREWDKEIKYAWNGLGFVEAEGARQPGVERCDPPVSLRARGARGYTRFAAAIFGPRRFFLRWTKAGSLHYLEVLNSAGRLLAKHRLADSFGATDSAGLGAMWLDEKRKRGPILETRDSDSVRLHVFSDGFEKLLCVQNFSDSSSSISATTVSFGRDRRGILIVTESASERGGEDGSGGESHHTDYVWTGREFLEKGEPEAIETSRRASTTP